MSLKVKYNSGRAFPVAASSIWNSLPDDVISAESLPTFQRKLKRHLFCQSFPGFCYWICTGSGPCSGSAT